MSEISITQRLIGPEAESDDLVQENSTRPQYLNDYIGQEDLKRNLKIFIKAARKRRESLDHVLFHGFPGLGKTTLAFIIAKELNVNIKATSGPVIERQGDLAAILTNLKPFDILFIDEIHRLNRAVEEILYPAMEDFKLDVIIGQGPGARALKLDLPRFTLVGATTRAGLLTPPLRDRFGVVLHMDFYTTPELTRIVSRSAKILAVHTDEEGSREIARRSRGTPRIANRLLRRVRDFAEVEGDGVITKNIADHALQMLEVDDKGFDKMDRKILLTIIEKFEGGPIGVDTLAAAIGEERDTIEDVYEPFLLQHGYINRTPRGRMATRRAYEHFSIDFNQGEQKTLF